LRWTTSRAARSGPCNLAPGQAQIVADVVGSVLRDAASIPASDDDFDAARNGGVMACLNWLSTGEGQTRNKSKRLARC
jgi:hypothetical protein